MTYPDTPGFKVAGTSEHIDSPSPTPAGARTICFTCGAPYLGGRGDGRFCSSRCRDGYDAGLPAFDPNYMRRITLLAEKTVRRTLVHKLKFRRKNASKNKGLQGRFSQRRKANASGRGRGPKQLAITATEGGRQ